MDREQIFGILREHRGKVLGMLCGLIFGLMTAFLGFGKALFIAFCVTAGYFIGRRWDGRQGFQDLLDRLFRGR
ncbi:MAG: hypothetical protein PWP65_470 [Clostridia bacterium]|nr:hypothetical protein [Clostridia bacterium]